MEGRRKIVFLRTLFMAPWSSQRNPWPLRGGSKHKKKAFALYYGEKRENTIPENFICGYLEWEAGREISDHSGEGQDRTKGTREHLKFNWSFPY